MVGSGMLVVEQIEEAEWSRREFSGKSAELSARVEIIQEGAHLNPAWIS